MRIALLTHQWPGARMGGIGAAVRQSAGALAAAGHDVHVFTLSLPDDVRVQLPAGVAVHEVADLAQRVRDGRLDAPLAAALNAGGEGAYRLGIGWLLSAAVLETHRERPFDVAEAPEVEALGLPLLLQSDFGAPVVTHLHCCTAIAHKGNRLNVDENGRLVAALEFAAIHLADAICAPTRAVVDVTRSFIPIAEDVRLIPHAYVCDAGPVEPPPGDGPILFVGRVERLKGVEALVAALNLFLPRHPAATFRFVGPDTNTADGGSMRQALEARLSASVRPRVRFTGELPPAQVAAEWRRASFGVMPSLRENFSLACCEAMAAGRTIIVGAGTGSVELVGEAGVVADPESPASLAAAMEQLWTDRGRLNQLSQAAYERIRRHFSAERVAALRAEFYQDIVRDFRARRGSDRSGRLASLPPQCAAAILPALGRITGMLAGVRMSPAQTPGTRLLRIMDELESRHGLPARVLLYGAGKHTARLLSERHVWESRRHRVVGIIDDHPRFAQTPVYLDLPVQSVETARAGLQDGKTIPPVVLSTDTYEDQFWTQAAPLREAGVPVFRLYS